MLKFHSVCHSLGPDTVKNHLQGVNFAILLHKGVPVAATAASIPSREINEKIKMMGAHFTRNWDIKVLAFRVGNVLICPSVNNGQRRTCDVCTWPSSGGILQDAGRPAVALKACRKLFIERQRYATSSMKEARSINIFFL